VTIVLVSHDPNRIRDLCDDVVWLRGGTVAAQGPPMEVTARYVQSQAEETKSLTPHDVPVSYTPGGVALEVHRNRFGSLEATIGAVRILDGWGHFGSTLTSGAPMRVEIELALPRDLTPVSLGATLRRADGLICFDASTRVDLDDDGGRLILEIERLDVAGGEYMLDVGLYDADWTRTYDYHYGTYPVTIVGTSPGAGVMAPPLSWHLETKAVVP
jgi:lipopolysaccharide transport system ATP-binding protein